MAKFITATYPALAIRLQFGAHEAVVLNGSHRLHWPVETSNSAVALEDGLANLQHRHMFSTLAFTMAGSGCQGSYLNGTTADLGFKEIAQVRRCPDCHGDSRLGMRRWCLVHCDLSPYALISKPEV